MFLDDIFKNTAEMQYFFLEAQLGPVYAQQIMTMPKNAADTRIKEMMPEENRQALVFFKYLYSYERSQKRHAGLWIGASFCDGFKITPPQTFPELEQILSNDMLIYKIGAAEEFFDIVISPDDI